MNLRQQNSKVLIFQAFIAISSLILGACGPKAVDFSNLAAGFSSFADVFTTKDFNFNMAIVSTDIRPVGTGQEGLFQGVPTVISSSTLNFATVFQNNIVLGFNGNPNATSLDAAT